MYILCYRDQLLKYPTNLYEIILLWWGMTGTRCAQKFHRYRLRFRRYIHAKHACFSPLHFTFEAGTLVQWLKLPAWKVRDRGFEHHSGLQVSKK